MVYKTTVIVLCRGVKKGELALCRGVNIIFLTLCRGVTKKKALCRGISSMSNSSNQDTKYYFL